MGPPRSFPYLRRVNWQADLPRAAKYSLHVSKKIKGGRNYEVAIQAEGDKKRGVALFHAALDQDPSILPRYATHSK